MRFAFSDDQLAFRDAVRDLLTKLAGPDALRAVWDGPLGWDPTVWSHLAEMGVLGLLAPESAGGMGLDEVDLVLILEECGRAALPGPIVEHVAVAIPALAEAATTPQAVPADAGNAPPAAMFAPSSGPSPAIAQWLEAAAAGEITLTATSLRTIPAGADGAAAGSNGAEVSKAGPAVAYGGDADVVIAERGGVVRAVSRDDVAVVERRTSVDGSRRFADITWSRSTPLRGADANLLRARGAAGAAAVLCGLAAHLIDTTAAYVKERHQFGVPIGSFQAVKHHLADALIALEHARPAVYCAAWSISTRQPALTRDASFAKVYANEAAGLAARVALQCHGAIGYTFEHDLHLWLKRVWSLQQAWGDTAHHRDQVAAALLD
jgi:alkylation response protein AidB-like acyl-CoA dehydrogenase